MSTAMSRFVVRMTTTNAAFHEDDGIEMRHAEVARILRHVADQVERGAGPCMDVNGNTIRTWRYEA